MRARLVPVMLVAALLAAALAPAAALSQSPEEPRASLPDIEDEVMCPICGTTLALSESPQAERERVFIRRLINEGLTKDEIKDRLVDEYGDEVLAIPGTQGFDLAAWLVPGAAILIAGFGLAVGVRRWRREPLAIGAAGSPGDGPSDSERQQLEDDLERYDL